MSSKRKGTKKSKGSAAKSENAVAELDMDIGAVWEAPPQRILKDPPKNTLAIREKVKKRAAICKGTGGESGVVVVVVVVFFFFFFFFFFFDFKYCTLHFFNNLEYIYNLKF